MELLTIPEVADLLRVRVPAVRRWIATGRLKTVRDGRKIRIPRDALDAYPISYFLQPPVTEEERARLIPPPTPEELQRRKKVYEETMALRATLPSIAPLTTRDLVLLARRGEEPRMISVSALRGMAVVDASVAAKWYLTDELYAEQAGVVFRAHILRQAELVAPMHILYEVPAAIHAATRVRPPRLTLVESRAAIDEFLRLQLRTFNGNALPREAHEFALETGVAYYDALYGALSRRLRIPLVVADRRFYLRVHPYVDAVWLGSVAAM